MVRDARKPVFGAAKRTCGLIRQASVEGGFLSGGGATRNAPWLVISGQLASDSPNGSHRSVGAGGTTGESDGRRTDVLLRVEGEGRRVPICIWHGAAPMSETTIVPEDE